VPRGAIVESPSFAAPADGDAASGPGTVVAADDDGELVDVDAFADDDGGADCAAAPAPVAAELESAALASVAPAMPIIETINADTSLLLNGGIMLALLGEDGEAAGLGRRNAFAVARNLPREAIDSQGTFGRAPATGRRIRCKLGAAVGEMLAAESRIRLHRCVAGLGLGTRDPGVGGRDRLPLRFQ